MATYTVDNVNTSNLAADDIINCDYSGTYKTLILPPGQYKLECWGAQGGTYSSYYGGFGGYSTGVLTLTIDTTLYLYAGGQPATNTSTDSSNISAGGFNGGGTSKVYSYSGTTSYGQGGGGASDIRIAQDSLYARVIVAGGGGGSSSDNGAGSKDGGGEYGNSPVSGYESSQTYAGTNGAFGQGANATGSYNYKYGAGGGGGGWYGGGSTSEVSDSSSSYRNYNGGGSGYVYTSSTASNYPSGCLLIAEDYLTNASTISGSNSFTSPTGTSETGHSGNGYVRITVISIDSLTNFNLKIKVNGIWYNTTSIYVKINGTWKTISNIYTKINGTWKSSS